MKKSLLLWSVLFAALSVFTLTSCDDDDDDQDDQNIVEFAVNSDDFTILADAVVRAGLTDALSGGELTVFAPTNAAFEAFLSANGFNTLDDVPVATLQTVLTNHVIGGELMSTELQTAYYTTLNETAYGANANIFVNTDGGVRLNGVAEVISADNEVSNGVIHAIDAVIPAPTVVTFATADPAFSSLVAALTAPGIPTDFVSVLSGDGPFTVFAPSNAAFQALLDSNSSWNSIADIPTDVLDAVLKYHVTTAGNVRSSALSDGQQVPTLQGDSFTIDLSGSTPAIIAGLNNANIIVTDVQAQNGVVHVIDTVILPE